MSNQTFPRSPSPFPRSFHVVAKPVGSRYNLQCTYCYYLHKDGLLPDRTGRMADDLLCRTFALWLKTGLGKVLVIKSLDGQPGHNYLCSGMKQFFTYADPYLRQIAAELLRYRAAQLPGTSVETAVPY